MRHLILIAILALTAGCFTNESDTIRTLHAAGFKDVHTTGYSLFSCGEDDFSSTGFIATNPNGDRVEGAVCCGMWTKGCTIRF